MTAYPSIRWRQLTQTRHAPPDMRPLRPAAMAACDIRHDRARLKAFRDNLRL
jgi:hypothetical protein